MSHRECAASQRVAGPIAELVKGGERVAKDRGLNAARHVLSLHTKLPQVLNSFCGCMYAPILRTALG